MKFPLDFSNIFVPLLASFVTGSFGRSERIAIMATDRNFVIFARLLLGLIFLLRLYFFHLKNKCGVRLVFLMYYSLLF